MCVRMCVRVYVYMYFIHAHAYICIHSIIVFFLKKESEDTRTIRFPKTQKV